MGPMPSPEPALLNADARHTLLEVARNSIEHGLREGRPLAVDPGTYASRLRAPGAAFVTLHERGALRGCIGHLEAIGPLVRDVAENAFAAAFRDPRFPPLQTHELDQLEIEISVLTEPEPLDCASEVELLRQIVPGRDGLILAEGASRGTFLPTVWESLPSPQDFIRHLKVKAGLRPDHWSEAIRVWRYHTESFSEDPQSA
jgi:AmmeMemoRadiSam system protein A